MRAGRAGAASLVVVLSLGACSGGGAPTPGPGAATPTADPGPSLEVGAPLWGTRETGIRGVTAFEPRGDRTILAGYGEYAEADTHVLGVDTGTGRVRWRRTLYQPVPGADGAVLWDDAVGVGDDGAVAVTLLEDGGVESASRIAVLDPDTGRLARRTDVVAAPRGSADPYLTVVDVARDVAVVTTTWYGSTVPDRAVRTTGVDLRTGRVLWQRRGLVAAAIVDDTVLASDAYQLDSAAPGRWRGLDLRDGSTSWAREPGSVEVLDGLATGLAVLGPNAAGDLDPQATPTSQVVDVGSGEVLLEVPRDAAATDWADDFGSGRAPGSVVAWLDEEDHLVTYAAGDERPSTSERTVEAPLFDVVADYVSVPGPGDSVDRQAVVDRAGEPVDVGGGAVLFYADDELVLTGRYSGRFEVLRRTS